VGPAEAIGATPTADDGLTTGRVMVLYLARHRRKPLGRWALLTALVAASACFTSLIVVFLGLANHGPEPPASASVIPASVKTTEPKLTVSTRERRVRTLSRSVPVRLRIPSIGVNAPITDVGLNANDTVQVPPLGNHNLAGWYKYGPTPGQLGPSVLLGHVDSVTGLSVFYYLKDLRKGDKVYVTLADGKTATFVVDGLQRVEKTAFPTADVYGKLSYAGLRLITCGGAFDPTTGHYLENIIVYAMLA
jgi:sortase (surface protein transpeptidase)